jgi:hypothetical protein
MEELPGLLFRPGASDSRAIDWLLCRTMAGRCDAGYVDRVC